MKKRLLIPILCVVTLFASCYATAGNSGKVPPGQVKKATGSKSAKPYAPVKTSTKKGLGFKSKAFFFIQR